MKIWQKIVVLLLIVVFIIGSIFYDSYFTAPSRIETRYETVSSSRIPVQLDGVKILFFSDLHFGKFMDLKRLQKVIKSINNSGADVVIFGGDMFHSDDLSLIDVDTLASVKDLFKSIKAPLGKFAIYGDQDHNNIDIVNQILFDTNFEILNNTSVKLRNKGSQSINLIGIDSEDNGNIDITSAYINSSMLSYTITLCHTPDTVSKIPKDITDLYLSGHSMGGQAYYIFDSLYKPNFTQLYYRGKHLINNRLIVDITGGVGTVIKDVRFLSNAEVVVYTLKHKEFKENTALPE